MANVFTLEVVIAIISVIGTWIGVYLAYRAIKKENKKIFNKFINFFNSGQISLSQDSKKNVQIGKNNENVQ